MEQKEIIAGNRLIANSPFASIAIIEDLKTYGESGDKVAIQCLYNSRKYHEDWNSLMSVIENIECVGYTYVEIVNKNCTIQPIVYSKEVDSMEHKSKIMENGESKINAAYKAVIKFITWYNTQSK